MPSSSSANDQDHHNSTLPVPNPTQSYWRTPPHPLDSLRSTPSLPTTCDILIIGAGLAGVSTLYHLLGEHSSSPAAASPPPSILLLDARQACSGATGRNGGHVKVKSVSLLNLIAQLGAAAGAALAAFVDAQIDALKAAVEKEQGLAAECEFELRRSYDVFFDAADAAWMEGQWRKAVRAGGAATWVRQRDFVGEAFAERVTGVGGARAAVSGPACSFWPYRFVMGLLERVVRRWGAEVVNVQMETAVWGVEGGGEGGSSVVRTERGAVRARKVVFATNAYTPGLVRKYEGVIRPYKGTCAHLAPGEGREPVFPHLSHTYNLEFGKERVDYLNPRPDGGIVVGGGKWLYEEQRELWDNTVDDSTLVEPVIKAKYFDGYMQRNFRGWEDSGTEVERIWTGIMGSTPDGVPHIGKVPGEQNQWILAGFNGGGNALIFLSAKGVARMVLDDVPFEETGTGIPAFFKTTEERLQNRL
ncbi:FAD dependent oxidoreductase [Botryosphaeria dothidea]|uniref:FAD dependent oxidoreductase n=1 Tax=Botryosphaeria dothidea TaxID=55169 RepID=A0A8H4J4K2_9PEZI|nr:FAD dependent oxidoreductase [Botryosphaeria dothidea]